MFKNAVEIKCLTLHYYINIKSLVMKRIFFSILFVITCTMIVHAQTETDDIFGLLANTEKQKMRTEDYFISEVFSDIWQQTPQGLKTATLNRGYNANILMDYPLGKSNFAFAIGLGLSFHNMYSNSILNREMDTIGNYTQNSVFTEIPESFSYKNNKLTLMYLDIPLEFRFRTKNLTDNFKFALGFKAGYNIKNYTKYHGDKLDGTLAHDGGAASIKFKEYNIPNIENLRYGITARIGYGRYNLFAYYALTPLMTKGKSNADDMFPISVGIAFSPF